MNSGTEASARSRPLSNFALTGAALARPRPLLGSAFLGAGLGLGLGAIFMASGLSQAAADRHWAQGAADLAHAGLSSAGAAGEDLAAAPGALRLAQAVTPPSLADIAVARQMAVRAGLPGAGRGGPARDIDCLTQAVYFEARGETSRGQAAVAQVVLNRVKSPVFPKSVCAVVYQGVANHGCQFSFACDGSMRRGVEPDAWDKARRVAARALSGAVLSDIGSATYFHTTGVAPAWGDQMLRVAQVGLHVFYRFNPHPPAARADDHAAPATETAVYVSLPSPAAASAAVAASLDDPPPAPTGQEVKPAAVVKTADPAPTAISAAAQATPAAAAS